MNITSKICIIGAGYAGICAGVQLKRELKCDDFLIIDENDDFGGVWFKNKYPGCVCDIHSHFYSYSFELNPNWSAAYAPQSEICNYLQNTAKKYGLQKNARFNAAVQSVNWDDELKTWNIHITDKTNNNAQTVISCTYLIMAVGTFSYKKIPVEFENFQETKFHSAEWDHTVDFVDKNVAVIGSGSSASQIIPEIAKKVGPQGEVHCYQRRTPWVIPKGQHKMPESVRWAFAHIPLLMWFYRCLIYILYEVRYISYIKNFVIQLIIPHVLWMIMKLKMEPHLQEKLLPDGKFGCLRPVLADDYYDVFAKPNVYIYRNKIKAINGDSIVTEDGLTRKIDILILATGFKPQEYFGSLKLTGAEKSDILQDWQTNGPESYFGIMVNRMPNCFLIQGPHSSGMHTSVTFMMECQVNFILQVLKECFKRKTHFVTVKKSAQQIWTRNVNQAMKSMSWGGPGCRAWYTDSRGMITTVWPGTSLSYYWKTRRVNLDHLQFVET